MRTYKCTAFLIPVSTLCYFAKRITYALFAMNYHFLKQSGQLCVENLSELFFEKWTFIFLYGVQCAYNLG